MNLNYLLLFFPLFSHSKSASSSWLSCQITPTSWIFTKMKKYPKNPKAASFWILVQVWCRWVEISFPLRFVFFFFNMFIQSSSIYSKSGLWSVWQWAKDSSGLKGFSGDQGCLNTCFDKIYLNELRKTENQQRKRQHGIIGAIWNKENKQGYKRERNKWWGWKGMSVL